MKKISLSLLFIGMFLQLYSQRLSGMLENGANKKAFSKALDKIQEKPNRSFYKTGNFNYIGTDIGSDGFEAFDNNIYADVEKNGDDLTVILYKGNSSSKDFPFCKYYHGHDAGNMKSTHFRKLDGDVYALVTDLDRLSGENDFILYSEEKGLYFHLLYYDTERGTKMGGGFYKKTKEEKIASADLEEEKKDFESYRDRYEKAVVTYQNNQKRLAIKTIMDKPDEGIVSDFQKQHIGKVLFGNKVTEENKSMAASYKSKFTLDEKISCSFFLDKGLTKTIDTSSSVIKENLNQNGESKFQIKVTIDGVKSGNNTIYIKNLSAKSKTSGVFDLVLRNATMGNNYWLQSLFPEKIEDKEHVVKVEVMPEGDLNTVIASGTYTYIPKKAAKVPNGFACNPATEIKNASILALKPRLKEIAAYSIALYNKKEGRNYSFVNLTIVSEWNTTVDEFGFNNTFLYVTLHCKDSKGNSFLFTDQFSSNDKSDMGYFEALAKRNFNVNFCDQ
ncbi:hypothetical protein D3C71_675430 [compost metagenome]